MDSVMIGVIPEINILKTEVKLNISIVKTEESPKEKIDITEEIQKAEIEPPKAKFDEPEEKPKTETLEVNFNKTGKKPQEEIETPKIELNQSKINPRAKIKIPQVKLDRKEEKPNAKMIKSKAPKAIKIDTRDGISRELCLRYAKSVYVLEYPAFNVPGAAPKNVSQCHVNHRPLIYGGSKAKGKEFPHMALIGYAEEDDIKWMCGGSLITEEWVLTAAHCAYTTFGEAKFVRLGELDFADDNDDSEPQDFDVIQIEKHPEHGISHYNDIALLKLNKKAKLTAYVRPACLWTKHDIENSKAIATGWGLTGWIPFFHNRSSHLLQVTLSLIPQSICNQTIFNPRRLNQGIIDEMQICAGVGENDKYKKDTCQGDSGGPLQIFANDVECMYYIIGVTSFGKPCGKTRAAGVYTRVSNYIPWIESTITSKT